MTSSEKQEFTSPYIIMWSLNTACVYPLPFFKSSSLQIRLSPEKTLCKSLLYCLGNNYQLKIPFFLRTDSNLFLLDAFKWKWIDFFEVYILED